MHGLFTRKKNLTGHLTNQVLAGLTVLIYVSVLCSLYASSDTAVGGLVTQCVRWLASPLSLVPVLSAITFLLASVVLL